MKQIWKKSLSLALTLALLFSLMTPAAFADEPESGKPAITVGSVEVRATDGTVIVPVEISNNPGIASCTLDFDIPAGWEMTKIETRQKTAYGIFYGLNDYNEMTPIGRATPNPAIGRLVWSHEADNHNNGTICWLTYQLPDGIVSGEYTIGIGIKTGSEDVPYLSSAKDTGENLSSQFTFTSGTVTVTDGVEEAAVTPAITTQPASGTYTYSTTPPTVEPLKVDVTVEQGGGELTYQWYKGNAAITNATANTYIPTLPAVGSSESYHCVITNTYQGRAYTVTSETATITYNKADQATLTVAGQDTVTYGETAAYTANGGSGTGDVTWSVEGNVATIDRDGVLTPTGIGTVNVKAEKAADGDYNATSANRYVTINAADLTLDGSESYDVTVYTARKPVTLTVPNATAKNGQKVNATWSTSGNVTLDNGAVTATENAKNGDTATVTLTYSADHHNSKTVTYHITVKDKTDVSDKLTFTSTGVKADYDGGAKTADTFVNAATMPEGYTGTITYTLNGQSSTNLSQLSVTDAGTYTITATYSDDENEGSRELTFTIDRARVEKPTAVTGLEYNGEEKTGVTYVANAGYTMSGTLTATNAGGYTATATLDDNHQWTDEATDSLTISWSIEQKEIDVSGYEWDYKGPFTYDGAERSVKVIVPEADQAFVDIAYYGVCNHIDAGSYTAVANAAVKQDYAQNYKIEGGIAKRDWKIEHAPIDVSGVKFEQADITYDGKKHTVSVTGLPQFVTVTYRGTSTATDAETYAAEAMLKPEKNYKLVSVDGQTQYFDGRVGINLIWKILRAEIPEAQEPSAVTGLVYNGAGQAGVTYVANAGYTMSGNLTATNAGDNYTATATPDGNHKWADGTTTPKTLDWRIDKKSVTLPNHTISLRYSNTAEQTFTAEQLKTLLGDTNPATTVSIGGASKTNNGVITAGATSNFERVRFTLNSGLTAQDAGRSDTLTVNYSSNNYTDGKVALVITVMDKEDVSESIIFENGSSTYDGADKTYEESTISGITAGDDPHWTYTYKQGDTELNAMKDAGSYTVIATYEDAENYGTKEAVYTISPATLTISSAVVDEKVYDGTTEATVTGVIFDGLVGDESVDYEVIVAAFENANVGVNKTVNFTVALDSSVTNYAIPQDSARATAKGTITAKGVIVSLADPEAQTYTGSDITPEPDVSASGTVNEYQLEKDKDYTLVYSNNRNVGTATVTVVPASGSNYTFSNASATFEIVAAELSGLTAENLVVTYTGRQLDASRIRGTAYFNGAQVPGTWSWVTEPADVEACETPYSARVRFTPESSNLLEAEADITVTIRKATPTGEPSYSVLTGTGKTLADAQLDIGTITPAGGTIRWVDEGGVELPLTTVVEPQEAYTWQYIPADPVNYNVLTGTITPCKYQNIPVVGPSNQTKVEQPDNGEIAVKPAHAAAGSTVTVTVTPDDGYVLEELRVLDKHGHELELKDLGNGRYSFTMPSGGVEVDATFAPEEQPAPVVFSDVPADAWYANAVYSAVEQGLFSGTGETTFAPEMPMSRSMLVTVLWRMSGEPAATAASGFADVQQGSWYQKAVDWASATGLVKGLGNNLFGSETNLSREQLATILFRYAQQLGLDTSARADLSAFGDFSQVSPYAQDAMSWAVAVGLISGTGDGSLAPMGDATRAQVATILLRFQDKFGL